MQVNDEIHQHSTSIDRYGNVICNCGKIFVRNMRPMGVYTLD